MNPNYEQLARATGNLENTIDIKYFPTIESIQSLIGERHFSNSSNYCDAMESALADTPTAQELADEEEPIVDDYTEADNEADTQESEIDEGDTDGNDWVNNA